MGAGGSYIAGARLGAADVTWSALLAMAVAGFMAPLDVLLFTRPSHEQALNLHNIQRIYSP